MYCGLVLLCPLWESLTTLVHFVVTLTIEEGTVCKLIHIVYNSHTCAYTKTTTGISHMRIHGGMKYSLK